MTYESAYNDAYAADPGLVPVLMALAHYESTYDPLAVGDAGTSFGYLQFHQGGGLGDGHAVADLLNGRYNMALGASYLRSRLAAGASLYEALSPWSTRELAWPEIGPIAVPELTPPELELTPNVQLQTPEAPTWVAGVVFLLALAYLFGGQ